MINPTDLTRAQALEPEDLVMLDRQVTELLRRESGTAFAGRGGTAWRLHTELEAAANHLDARRRDVQEGRRPASAYESARLEVISSLRNVVGRLVAEMQPLARAVRGEFASDTEALWRIGQELNRLGAIAQKSQGELARAEREAAALAAQAAEVAAAAPAPAAPSESAAPSVSAATTPTPTEQARHAALVGGVNVLAHTLRGRLQHSTYQQIAPLLAQAREAAGAGDAARLRTAVADLQVQLDTLPSHDQGIGARQLADLTEILSSDAAAAPPAPATTRRPMPGLSQSIVAGQGKGGISRTNSIAG